MIVGIVALFFLTRSIGKLALEKNQPALKWKLNVIFAWIAGDLTGEMIVYYFFGLELIPLAVFGIGMGYLGYLLVKRSLESIPENE